MRWATAMFLSPVLLCIGVQGVRAEAEKWTEDLRRQLKSAESCDLVFMTGVKEYHLGDNNIVQARITCGDGRSFDVTRPDAGQEFKIESCMPTAC
jgi:ethanolamine ammonia-lyase small subunit